MSNIPKDLREFIESCRQIGELKEIDGADWNREIGALTEATAELITNPPMLLFDNIKDYPSGYRVLSLPLASPKRDAIALGLPLDKNKLELTRLAVRKMKEATPIPPVEVATGPVMENVMLGDDIDLWKFPVPQFHLLDGGRYIGTGDSFINQDPETGYINMGTYRMQVHEKNLLGLWMSPGQQGRQICQRYWDQGKSCPVVATFGGDQMTFLASHTKFPWGVSELDYVGGLRGEAVEVIKGPITGLPIPAYAEIAIEGEVPPPNVESRAEGPFGEWPGYYSGGTIGTGEDQPVIRVKAIYHRNNPIIVNMSPMWPGAPTHGLRLSAGLLWDQLESAGVQDVTGVYTFNNFLVVISIRQRFGGHAQQVGMAALGCAAQARNGRYIVIVDDDIDITDIQEVLWAMETRVEPSTDIKIIDDLWTSPLDPVMTPEKRKARDYTNGRAIFYAVRPFTWKDEYPKVSRTEKDLRQQVVEKYKSMIPFPNIY